ncbi:hypothetical protein Bbelb_042570 [Branchiostoma belcheri]|nr:hypothetical protein Bbelb_042570 [Branchiostoma belcheri]
MAAEHGAGEIFAETSSLEDDKRSRTGHHHRLLSTDLQAAELDITASQGGSQRQADQWRAQYAEALHPLEGHAELRPVCVPVGPVHRITFQEDLCSCLFQEDVPVFLRDLSPATRQENIGLDHCTNEELTVVAAFQNLARSVIRTSHADP